MPSGTNQLLFTLPSGKTSPLFLLPCKGTESSNCVKVILVSGFISAESFMVVSTCAKDQWIRNRIKSKNLDCIVLNSTEDSGAGFAHDTNKVTILDKNMTKTRLSLKSKYEIADEIVDFVIESLSKKV
jgi:UDP-N-acetylglucosamine enolpyruvyl transferase